MRKRAQRRSRPTVEEPKHIIQKTRIEKKPAGIKKNWWVALSLIGIFFLVLFFNSYFNITSEQTIDTEGEGFDKFYLSGPDPYYNMRLVEETLYGEKAGRYPFYSDPDPLLDYPRGKSGGRPPLLNMMAIGFSRFLAPFMDEVDAVGYSMQFVPALFGALLIFPVYFIGKTLFGRREGLVAALFVAIIPIHLSSGHGSAYSLFDHDSFNLLLFFLAFLFLIKGLKEKDPVKSVLFALLSGVFVAALSMTWTEARFLYVVIAIYAIVQMLLDVFTDKIEPVVFRTTSVVLLSGYLISLPVRMVKWGGFGPDLTLFLCIGVAVFGVAYYIFGKKRIPWTLSLPFIFCVIVIGIVSLYFIEDISSHLPFFSSLSGLSDILYGSGIYGSKVSLTIAEAHTYGISNTVMSFGPALYWLGWAGFLLLAYYYYKGGKRGDGGVGGSGGQRRDYLFIIVLFIVDMWLAGAAGRFLNDMVPLIAILGGWIVFIVVDKIDYKQMLRNIRGAGGGFHGLRRGVKALHIIGILFIALLVVFPNTYLAFDAAVPYTKKDDIFGEDLASGAFGLPHGKEAYWMDAYSWLKEQDIEIENPIDRPAFISWWDYGFYESAVGEHPTVADNFQDGIPPAANFHTAASEEEAVAVWIIRLLEGDLHDNDGNLSEDVIRILEKHVGENNTINITGWIENPRGSPSYNAPIGEEYDKKLSEQYRVGEQWPENAAYHDITDILTARLDDEGITWLYHDIQNATGYSIRYYGVEGYDKQIFNIFGFLADKSLLMVAGAPYAVYNPEDDFVQVKYVMQNNNELTFNQLENLSEDELRNNPPVITSGVYSTRAHYKDIYFETMFYRTYIGVSAGASGSKSEPNYQLPCINMRHFYAEYISDISKGVYYTNKVPVVIAKYYEGAYVNGAVTFMDSLMQLQSQVVVQKNITHYGMEIPIDHDTDVTSDGMFNVIAPAGNITLQIRRNLELGAGAFVLKNVTFNGHEGSELAPISDDDAMRINGSNYERAVGNITIEPVSVEGYVYENKDNNTNYNTSNDEPLDNVKVTLCEIIEFNEDELINNNRLVPLNIGPERSVITNESGYYNFSNLMPGYYVITAEQDDFVIYANYGVTLHSGNNSYNMSKLEPVTIDGKVYYDAITNEQYDPGEEISDANVELFYKKFDIRGELTEEIMVNVTQTDEKGEYSFSSLIPGQYVINATKLNTTTGYLDYAIEKPVTITGSRTENISIDLAPVTVSGYTKYGNETIGNATISFLMNGSIENNTATSFQIVKSDNETGYYEVMLMPGYYNVSVNETVKEDSKNVTYIFSGQLELQKGQGRKPFFDIMMTREENQ